MKDAFADAREAAEKGLATHEPPLTPAQVLWREEEAYMTLPRTYYDMIRTEISFVQRLIAISHALCEVPVIHRLSQLKADLTDLNRSLPCSAFVPLCSIHDRASCVLRISTEEAFVFSTRERAPYLVCIEVLTSPHRWKSPNVAVGDPYVTPPPPLTPGERPIHTHTQIPADHRPLSSGGRETEGDRQTDTHTTE
eukprot:Tamp_28692.p1 GENE.Tamp_28692~~Tamp_28692.p1  ORF type:complete len:224 (+),score=20.99 Tamp_28692:90-674(+)